MRLVIASALAVLTATPALAAEAHQFQADGITYDYVAERRHDGSIRLTGHDVHAGEAFSLNVRNRHVEGMYGISPVSFTVSQATAERLEGEVANDRVETASN